MRICYQVGFAGQVDHRVKIKERQKDWQILGPCWRTKSVEQEGGNDINCNWCA